MAAPQLSQTFGKRYRLRTVSYLHTYILTPALVAVIICSTSEYLTFRQYAQLQVHSTARQGESRVDILENDALNVFEVGEAYERLNERMFPPPGSGYIAAQMLYQTGLQERDEAQRIALFCRALAQLGLGIQREPNNSRLLINWANLRQILSQVECPQAHTSGDYQAVARYALERDPTNSEVLFSAGQILLWAQNKAEAYPLFKRFLELTQTVAQRQYQLIDRQLTSSEAIVAIIPARFPQIVEWSSRLSDKNHSLFTEASRTITNMQLDAILNNEVEHKQGRIPTQIYFDRLLALSNVVSSSKVRQRIDGELARHYGLEGQEAVHHYLEQRKHADTIEVVRSFAQNDTRPLRSSLVSWDPLDMITLDTFYTTIGFYLPRQATTDFVELVGDSDSPLISPVSFKVLVSDSNQDWEDVTANVKIETIEFGRRPRLIVQTKGMARRFWKIHFASAAREGRFSNYLPAMLQVYGSYSK